MSYAMPAIFAVSPVLNAADVLAMQISAGAHSAMETLNGIASAPNAQFIQPEAMQAIREYMTLYHGASGREKRLACRQVMAALMCSAAKLDIERALKRRPPRAAENANAPAFLPAVTRRPSVAEATPDGVFLAAPPSRGRRSAAPSKRMPEQTGEAFFREGRALASQGRLDQALPKFVKAWFMFYDLRNSQRMAEISRLIADIAGGAIADLFENVLSGEKDIEAVYRARFDALSTFEREAERITFWNLLTSASDRMFTIRPTRALILLLWDMFVISADSAGYPSRVLWEKITARYVADGAPSWAYLLAYQMLYDSCDPSFWADTLIEAIKKRGVRRDVKYYILLAETLKRASPDARALVAESLAEILPSAGPEEARCMRIALGLSGFVVGIGTEDRRCVVIDCGGGSGDEPSARAGSLMQQDVRMAEIRDALFDGAELWEDYGRMLAAFSFDFRESERNRLWLRLSSNPQLTAYILRKNRHAVDSILSIFFDDMAAGDEENPRRHKNVFDRVREGQEWVLPLLEGMVREERFIRNYRGWVIELLKAASSGFGLDAGAYKIRTVVLDLPDSEKKALGLIALACLLTDGEAHVRRFAHKLLTSIKADAGMLGVIRRIASPDELALYMLYLSTPHKRLEAMLGIPDGHNPTADTGRPN